MADKVYKQPRVFPYDGRWNHGEYRNKAIDFRDYVVETGPEAGFGMSENGAGMWGWGAYVIVKGPLKVAASTEDLTEKKHVTEIVTIPHGKTVKFQNLIDKPENKPKRHDYNLAVAPVLIPTPTIPPSVKVRTKLLNEGYIIKQWMWLRYDASRVE